MKRRVLALFAGFAALCAGAHAEVRLTGRVTNENGAPLAGARVFVRPEGRGPEARLSCITAPTGAFVLRLPQPGGYIVEAEREGHFRLTGRRITLGEGSNEVQLVLNRLREVFEKVDVTASTVAVDMDRTTPEKALKGTDILAVPYPTTNNLKNALRIMPGVVQDSRGGVHINGASEDQVLYTLDGFTVNDPLTGKLESRVSVEAVQSVEIMSGNLPAEYGKGSAGTMAVTTVSGADRMRYSGTNFIPGFENRKGLTLGDWTPRFGVSGPIRKGRAWFSDSLALQYSKHIILELPEDRDRTSEWRASNLLHTQVNLTPSNILFGGFLSNVWTAPQAGLGVLDPPETTTDRRSRQWFAHVKDQMYFARGGVIEAGYAANRTFGREVPQGRGLYLLTPDGKRGNAYIDAVRKASRDQVIANLFVPAFRAAGAHQIKGGIDLDRVSYWQDVYRTGYEYTRPDLTPRVRVLFAGDGRLQRTNLEAAGYVQDSWRVRPSLLVEAGLRTDWDRLVRTWSASPRVGIAWSPRRLETTKIFGGMSSIHDAAPLRLFARARDQYSLTYYFYPDGRLFRGPAISIFTIGNPALRMPNYTTASLGIEQRLPAGIQFRAIGTRRRGRNGFAYLNLIGPTDPPGPDLVSAWGTNVFDAIYDLGNHRLDVYDSVEFTVRQPFRGQYEWMASYTRSRTLSNSVIDLSADDPFLVPENIGPMPWDTPNRLISWGYLPTFWKDWAVAYLAEARNGFPFSVVSEDASVIEPVNSRRFPFFFEVNLHVERRFSLRGHRWAFRAGFNNLTGRDNPNGVNNNASSANFLRFYGGQNRSLNFRIRWLGRK